jgi:hypothetical protein
VRERGIREMEGEKKGGIFVFEFFHVFINFGREGKGKRKEEEGKESMDTILRRSNFLVVII